MSAIDLARLQFAFTVSAHIIFPAFTIGLASYLAVLEALWLRTNNSIYLTVFNFWLRIFAVVFGMGVVSGLVMSYQFGTNWSVFSDKTGPVLGPLLGYEVLSAFFLEAGFLGIMLFGLRRVGPQLHFVATLMVAIGTLFSAFWILSANSWMQTPAGYAINSKGQFVSLDWWQVIFNPSFPYRFVHMVFAAYLPVVVDPDVLAACIDVVAAGGGEGEFTEYLDLYRSAATPQDEQRYLYALGDFDHPALVRRALDLALSDEVRAQSAPFLIGRALSNRSRGTPRVGDRA